MRRKSEVKFSILHFFICVQATDQTEHVLALERGGRRHDLAGVERSRVFALMIGLLLGLLSFFCFDFSSLLGGGFRTIISNLIPEENLWTVDFSTMDK